MTRQCGATTPASPGLTARTFPAFHHCTRTADDLHIDGMHYDGINFAMWAVDEDNPIGADEIDART